MKSLLWLLILIMPVMVFCQEKKTGTIKTIKFSAASIENNSGGEDPVRRLSIYLPPSYNESQERYPTIYFLHGFAMDDSLMLAWTDIEELIDKAIVSGRIRPMILVLPNSDTRFKGSFYTNSSLTGKWADYIGRDVVSYMDKNFRTIPNRDSRGLAGHSMGGHGALKIGMLFPDVFSSVYALSPAALNWSNEFNIKHAAFKKIIAATTETDILNELKARNPSTVSFYSVVFSSLARTYSPNENKAPLRANLPVSYIKDSMVVNVDILKQWEKNLPFHMIDDHIPGLKSLKALKIDWGRNEEFPHIPATALQFSEKLEGYGIRHYAEEYMGTHTNKLGGSDGRLYTEMFPFFDTYLVFK